MWHPDSIYDTAGHLDEGVLHAWIDGELVPEDAREVAAHSGACAACAARVAEARGMIAGSSRILSALDDDLGSGAGRPSSGPAASQASGHPPAGGGSDIAAWRRRWSTRRLSLAAAAALVFVAGTVVARDGWQDGASREAVGAADFATVPASDRAVVATSADSAAAGSARADATGAGLTGLESQAAARTAPDSRAAAGTGPGSPAISRAPGLSEAPTTAQPDVGAGRQASSQPSPSPGLARQRVMSGQVAGNVPQGTGAVQGREGAQSRPLPPTPRSGGIGSVAAAARDAAPAGPPAVVPAPAAPVPAPAVGAAAVQAPRGRRPLGAGGEDIKLEAVVVTSTEAAADPRRAREGGAAERAATVGVGRSPVSNAPSAPSTVAQVSGPRKAPILSGCWRIGVSDSTLRVGSTVDVASLVVGRAAPMAVRIEAADTLQAVRFWPAASPVADSTGRVVQRARLASVPCG